ncbi:hypothetical protein RISK_000073 [Rhodopirellula islandica]|uniref:Uncharacterized protein n=1 Tax=Rhodopirellula islandica TaxID=595434 RepID=A0A0J1ER06_RHOIS|nr:hypothetical protein RISK_000073 [Rhodopirellula islandica]
MVEMDAEQADDNAFFVHIPQYNWRAFWISLGCVAHSRELSCVFVSHCGDASYVLCRGFGTGDALRNQPQHSKFSSTRLP